VDNTGSIRISVSAASLVVHFSPEIPEMEFARILPPMLLSAEPLKPSCCRILASRIVNGIGDKRTSTTGVSMPIDPRGLQH
jgi:hypothetical protein